MSTGMIIAIVVIALILTALFAVVLPRARKGAEMKKRERELEQRRDDRADEHRAEAAERRNEAETLLRLRADDPRASIQAHGLLEEIQLWEDADALARAMEAKFGQIADVRVHLGDVLDRRGKVSDARAHYAAAHAIDPALPAAREALACFAARDGEIEPALDLLKPVLEARSMRSTGRSRPARRRATSGWRARSCRHGR